jgi:hypothetical protein
MILPRTITDRHFGVDRATLPAGAAVRNAHSGQSHRSLQEVKGTLFRLAWGKRPDAPGVCAAGSFARPPVRSSPLKAFVFLHEFGQRRFVQFVQDVAQLLMVARPRSE